MNGRNEAWTARGKDGGRKRAEEGLSEEGGSKGVKKTSREVSRGGHRPVYSIFTNHKQRGPWP